jgi:hypothetical protein
LASLLLSRSGKMKYSKVTHRTRPENLAYIDFVHNPGLDELSHWLRIDKQFGYAVLFALIFLTTFRKSYVRWQLMRAMTYNENSQLPFHCIPYVFIDNLYAH